MEFVEYNRLNTIKEIDLTKIVKYAKIIATQNNYNLLESLKAWESLYRNDKKLDNDFFRILKKRLQDWK